MLRIKRRHLIGILVAVGLLGAGAGALVQFVGQSKVSPEAIASSVTRTPELLERAWRLPVAATFAGKSLGNQMARDVGPPPLPMPIGRWGRRRC